MGYGAAYGRPTGPCKRPHVRFILGLFGSYPAFDRSRNGLALEIKELRHQVSVLKRKDLRSILSPKDRMFWVFLRPTWAWWERCW